MTTSDEFESVEFEIIEKVQIWHEDSEKGLEYQFGKEDFVSKDSDFYLKTEIANTLILKMNAFFNVSFLPIFADMGETVDLISFMDFFLEEEKFVLLSNVAQNPENEKVWANIFVLESAEEMTLESGNWQEINTIDALNDELGLEMGYLAETMKIRENILNQMTNEDLEKLLGGDAQPAILEEFMNSLIASLVDSKCQLSDQAAFDEYLRICGNHSQAMSMRHTQQENIETENQEQPTSNTESSVVHPASQNGAFETKDISKDDENARKK